MIGPNIHNTHLDFFIKLCRERIDKIFNNCAEYGYVKNFLYQKEICEADREAKGWQNSMLHRVMFEHVLRALFARHQLDNDPIDLLNMGDDEKRKLLENLAEKAVPLFIADDKKNNLTQNKIISRTGYLMEMITSSNYWIVTENEILSRDLLNKLFELHSEMKNSEGHVANDAMLISGDNPIALNDLNKMMVRKSLSKDLLPEDFRDQGNYLVLGTMLFDYPEGQTIPQQVSELRKNNNNCLSERLLSLAVKINHNNYQIKGHQGYCTGISLTAMRYLFLLGFNQDYRKENFHKEKLEITKILLSHIAKTDILDFYDIKCDQDGEIILESIYEPKCKDDVTGNKFIKEFSHHSVLEVLIAMNIFEGVFINNNGKQNELNQNGFADVIEESVSRAYKSLGIEEQLNKELERMR